MIVPAVTKFLSDYPDCRADLRFNDRIVDILAGEIDVAIRVGWLIDSSLRARRLGGFRQLLVASQRRQSDRAIQMSRARRRTTREARQIELAPLAASSAD